MHYNSHQHHRQDIYSFLIPLLFLNGIPLSKPNNTIDFSVFPVYGHQKMSSSNYKNDKYYKKIVNAFIEILKQKSVVAPVDVFMQMGNLNKKDYENWRFGRVPYLEKVIEGSLSKIIRQLIIIQLHAKDRGFKLSQSVYKKWGKGRKTKLQFSKSGKPSYEFAFSMHYVSEARKNTDRSTIPRKVEGCDNYSKKVDANYTLLSS